MGARNVSGAYLMWSHLADGPFRVLVGMALRSLDADGPTTPARRWYGGEADLVGFVRQTNAAGELRTYKARRSAAYRYLEQLREAGAVRVVSSGHAGRRAVYEVRVDPMQGPTASDAEVSEPVGPNVSEPVGPNVSEPVGPLGTTEEPLRKDERGEPGMTAPQRVTHAAGGDDEQGWSDVVLVEDAASAEHYPAALAFLERTIGAQRAGDRLAGHIAEHPDKSYVVAVVDVARADGWTP